MLRLKATLVIWYLIAIFLGYFIGGLVNCYQRAHNSRTTINNAYRMIK